MYELYFCSVNAPFVANKAPGEPKRNLLHLGKSGFIYLQKTMERYTLKHVNIFRVAFIF